MRDKFKELQASVRGMVDRLTELRDHELSEHLTEEEATTLASEFAALKNLQGLVDALDDVLDEIEEDYEEEIIEHFIDRGVQNVKTDEGTVYLWSQNWGSIKKSEIEENRDQVIRALDSLGLDEGLIEERINTQTLAARLREKVEEQFDEDDPQSFEQYVESLPDHVQEVLQTWTNTDVRVRQS